MGVNYETYGEKGKRYLINDGWLINLFGDCTDRCIREYLDSIMVSRKKNSKNTPTKLKFTVLLASG